MKLDENTVKKLEEAFAIGADVSAACFYADISRQTYYNWVNNDKKLKEKFDSLRERPVLKAYQTVAKNLDNIETAKWFLERKRKNEFSLKQEIDHTTRGEKIIYTDEQLKQIAKRILSDSQSKGEGEVN